MKVHKLKRAVFDRNGLIIQTKESAVHYRISEKPCGPDKNGYFFYSLTRIDALTKNPIGKKRRLSLGTKKQKEAEKRLRKIQQELQDHSPDNRKDILYGELVQAFDNSERVRINDRELSQSTHDCNLRYLEKFRVFLKIKFHTETVYLSEITGEDARLFLDSLKGRRPEEAGTRSRQYAQGSLRRLFNFAIQNGKIKENPFLQTRKIVMKHKKVDPFLPEEVRYLLSRIPESTFAYRTWRNGIRFDYNTGLRNSELRRIQLKDLHQLTDGLLYVHLQITKNGEERCVPIESEALQAYSEQLENLNKQFGENLSPELPLFPNERGKMLYISTVSKWITKLIELYAPHLKGKTFHSLRKTTADEVRKRSGNSGTKIASEILGHGSEAVTKKFYLTEPKADIHQHAEALAKMERITPSPEKKKPASDKAPLFPAELLDTQNHLN